MTLESQYKNYLKMNPDSDLTQEQWVSQILGPMLHKALSQMGNEEPGTIWLDTETGNINTENDEN
jgi:hypothetical protein